MKNRTFASLAASALLAFGISSFAQAGVTGSAFVEMSELTFFGSDGEILDNDTDFDQLTFTGTADENVSLGTDSDARSGTLPPASIDLPVICVGTCPQVGENAFPVISGLPVATYATSDQRETGAPIANLPGFATGATVANGSYVGIDTGSTAASANTNNNLNSSWVFSLAQSQGVTIRFAARAYLEAFASADEIFPGFSTASYNVLFSISDLANGVGTEVFSWRPNGAGGNIVGGSVSSDPFNLNTTVSLNAPVFVDISNTAGIHTPGVASSGDFSATTDPLIAGRLYQLSMRTEANADAQRVDVPVVSGACRLTGGGVSIDTTPDGQTYLVWDGDTLVDGENDAFNRYQFGGQVGANTALPPSPKGEWQHHQQKGPAGKFSFHGGTASAPDGTEIVEIRCSDPGGCSPSGNPPSPNKQLDFDGIGTFHNIGKGKNAPAWLIFDPRVTAEGHGNKDFDGTFHWFEVNVDDLGEGPDPDEGDDGACPLQGFGEKGVDVPEANCDCPDFYRITIYNGVDAGMEARDADGRIIPSSLNQSEVIYEVSGYLGLGGNGLQLHTLTGFDRN